MLSSIKTTILAALVGLQVIATGIIISSSFVTSETAVLSQAEQLMVETAKNTIRHTQNFLHDAETAVQLSQGLKQDGLLNADNPDEIERYFFEHLRVSPKISGLYYGDAAGRFLFVSRSKVVDRAEFRTKLISKQGSGADYTYRDRSYRSVGTDTDPADSYDPRLRPWYKKAVSTRNTMWTEPYIFYTSQAPGISVGAPVFDAQGDVAGVVGIDMDIAEISNFLRQLDIGESGKALILSKNGDVIAHPDPTKIKKLKEDGQDGLRFAKIDEIDDAIARAIVEGISGQSGNVDFSVDQFTRVTVGDEVFDAVFAPFRIGNLEWTIAIYVPEDDFLGPIFQSRKQSVVVAVSIACLTVLLGWLIARSITSPLTRLSKCADQIARGEKADTESLPENFSEVKHVSTAFRRMTRWLDDYRQQNSAMNEELKTAAKKLEVRVEDLRTEIADRKRAEAQSQQLQNELAHVTRVSTTGEMAASLAHELNQPLTAITQYCDVVLQSASAEMSSDKELVECIEEMQDQAFRAGEIIRQLRQFIRKGETDAEYVSLGRLISQTVRLIEPQARENNIEIIIDVDEEAPKISVNRVQIAQVLVNLLRNSVEAITASGTEQRRIIVREVRWQDLVEITVEDTGPGILSADHAFKPFETSKPEGMGMGLSISRSIIEAHHGSLTADDSITTGARFRVILPVQRRQAAS